MPIVLPHSYSTGRVVRIPVKPQTIGEHIRERRLERKMLQREVAAEIGVDKTTVFNWEAGTVRPAGRYMGEIANFLGYDPLPDAVPERRPGNPAHGTAPQRLTCD